MGITHPTFARSSFQLSKFEMPLRVKTYIAILRSSRRKSGYQTLVVETTSGTKRPFICDTQALNSATFLSNAARSTKKKPSVGVAAFSPVKMACSVTYWLQLRRSKFTRHRSARDANICRRKLSCLKSAVWLPDRHLWILINHRKLHCDKLC